MAGDRSLSPDRHCITCGGSGFTSAGRCHVCLGFGGDPFTDESKRGTIFHDHTCYRCRDGDLPCRHKGNERNCDTLRARND